METILLKDYINILRKHSLVFIVVVLICVAAAALVSFVVPKSYTSSIDVYVSHAEAESSHSYYTYDGYYANQASVQYTNTIAGFLESLSTVDNAAGIVQQDPSYKQGSFQPQDLQSQTDYLAKFQKNISVKIVAPQLINVSVHDDNPTVAKLWAQSLGTVVTNNIKALNSQGNINYQIDTIHDPITQTVSLSLTLDLIIGLVVGIFLGFSIGFILEANKK